MTYCFTCGNRGFDEKDCPECGREANNKSLNLAYEKNTTELVKKFDNVMIPNKYHGVFWNKETLDADNRDKIAEYNETGYNDLLFQRYSKQLEKINMIFVQKQIPHKSAIIIAPAGYSKMTFAYSCMQRAINAGFSVAPLLDTTEVKRVLILASENVKYKINGYMSYDDYIACDILFVTVTKLYTYGEAYQVIQELIDRRTRRGLSTFVISRFSIAEISKFDKTGSFKAILKENELDDFKYPAIIQYKERI